MAQSVEHEFISTKFDEVLNAFSATKLMGVNESDRKRFDYSCVIERDCSRPLVSQVLWSHTEGIDKDLRGRIVRHLMPDSVEREDDQNDSDTSGMNTLTELIISAEHCYSQFGRDLLEGIGDEHPKFYDTYDWGRFYEDVKGAPGLTSEFFSDPDSHFLTMPDNSVQADAHSSRR